MGFRHSAYTLFLMIGIVLIVSGISTAQPPGLVNYQGSLTDDTGTPVPDGSYDMRFYLFNAETGGSQLDWNSPDGEEQSVLVINGVYNIQLGSVEPLNPDIFSGGTAWLETAIYYPGTGAWETMSPRQEITSVPYALKAGDADTLAGRTLSDLNAAYVNLGETNAITTEMISNNSITASDLATNSVAAAEIAAGAVNSSELANNAVTAKKLAMDSVGSPHIIDGSVTANDLAEDYVKTTGDAISGTKDSYLFSVANNGTNDTARGIYARGNGYGLYAEEVGDGDVGIYSPDVIQGGGFRSSRDSYMWFPGTLAIKGNRPTSNISYTFNGAITIQKTSSAGLANVFLPIALPGNLFGQNVKIEEIRVYYQCSSAAGYITTTWLNKQTGASTYTQLVEDFTDYTSTSDAYFNLYPNPHEIDTSQGILNLHCLMRFENTSDTVTVGGIRVRLGHQ